MASADFVARLTRQAIEIEAAKVRRAFGLKDEADFPILRLVELYGPILFPGFELHVDPQEIMGNEEAYVATSPTRMVLSERTQARGTANEKRARFTVAHEIGHLALHLAYLQGLDAKAARTSHNLSQISPLSEQQANAFAAALLLPEHVVRRFATPDELSQAAGVSVTTAEIRMRELSLWPKRSDKVVRGFEILLAELRAGPNVTLPKVPSPFSRSESWGSLHYDFQKDEFSAEAAEGSSLIPSAPIGLGWVITGRCDQRCGICYGNFEELARNELSRQDCLRAADAIVAGQIMRVVISGGEPLLHPATADVVERLTANNVAVVLGTNGTYLTTANIGHFARCARIEISLDAPSAELNNRLRPSAQKTENAFTQATSAIKLAISAGIPTRVLTTLSSQNQDQIVLLANLLMSIGVRDWALSWTVRAGRAVRRFEQLRPSADVIDDQLAEVARLYPALHVRYSHRGPDYNRFYFLVLPDGEIATQDVILGRKVQYGSVLSAPIKSIWTDDRFDKKAHFRKWVADRVYPGA